jgi:spermidine/putrescine transport system permease protein
MPEAKEQDWRDARGPFAIILGPPAFWLIAFFLIPLAIIWAYSFGKPLGLTEVAITGTLSNYARILDPVYLQVFLKSAWYAALTTFLCLVVGFPVALVITFATERGKALLLLAVMLPFWTNLLIRTYALMAVLRTEGYVNTIIGWLGFGPWPLLHNNFAVTLGLVYVNLPFLVLPLYSALDRLDRSLL